VYRRRQASSHRTLLTNDPARLAHRL
jgi:hypothetical protein